MVFSALWVIVLLAAGLFAWSFLEYAIHGWMGHRFRTFATPLHAVHHRDPHAVFALGAWPPAAAPLLIALALGAHRWALFYGGVLSGFAAYEALHYRIHFSAPACRIEARLRSYHLAHHYCAPALCFGVTTRLWDRIFSTEPSLTEEAEFASRVALIEPLEGKSNLADPTAVVRRLVAGLAQR